MHVCLSQAYVPARVQEAALEQAAAMQQALLRSQAEAAAQLDAESARRAQAEEAVEQYIAAHYASQAAAQVKTIPSLCQIVVWESCMSMSWSCRRCALHSQR